MLVGSQSTFAIESRIDLVDPHDACNPLIGAIAFHALDRRIGELSGTSDLFASLTWARCFMETYDDRFEPEFEYASDEDVFHAVWDPIYITRLADESWHDAIDRSRENSCIPPFRDARDRFDMSDIGGVDFTDTYNLICVYDGRGFDRLIWRYIADRKIDAVRIPVGIISNVLKTWIALPKAISM